MLRLLLHGGLDVFKIKVLLDIMAFLFLKSLLELNEQNTLNQILVDSDLSLIILTKHLNQDLVLYLDIMEFSLFQIDGVPFLCERAYRSNTEKSS